MAAPLTIETSDKELPLLLLYALEEQNVLTAFLEKLLAKDSKVVLAGGARSTQGGRVIEKSKTFLIKNLNETVSYGVITLTKPQEKKDVLQVINKFEHDNTKFTVMIPVDLVSSFYDLIIELKKNKYATILILGDIFGKNFPQALLSIVINKTLHDKKAFFPGSNPSPIYPISDVDFGTALKSVLYGRDKKKKIYTLYYNNPQTFLSLVHLLKRVEPELTIIFNGKKEQNIRISHDLLEKNLVSKVMQNPFPLDASLLGFEKSVRQMEDSSAAYAALRTQEKKPRKITRAAFHPKMRRMLGAVILGLLLEVMLAVALLFVSFTYFLNFKSEVVTGSILKAEKSIESAYKINSVASGTVGSLAGVISIFDHGIANWFYQTYSEGLYFAHTFLFDILNVTRGKLKISSPALSSVVADSIYTYFMLQEQNILPLQAVTHLGSVVSAMQVLPQVVGVNQDITYLLLFQNNGELRPTGGFIGSVGELHIKNGIIEIQNIQDVYDLDGQLKGHIEPPFVERRYMQPHLYLRESNYNPNFEITASTSAFLYNLESGKKVDGVIALDFEVIKKILEVTGPTYLPQENKTIDSANVFEFLQSQIEGESFPGSRVKKDLLNQLMTQLMLRFEQNKLIQFKIFALLPDLLQQKHILLSVQNPAIHALLAANGFTGNLKDTRVQAEGNIYDIFGVNEANIGVNKANIHVARSVVYSASIGKSKKSIRASLHLDNTGNDAYKAYVRILTPSGTVINKILINGVEQKQVNAVTDPAVYEAKNFKPPVGLEVAREVQEGKTFTGFLVSVPARSKLEIIVTYDQPINLVNAKVLYSLLYLVQPGTNAYPLTIQVEGDDGYVPQESKQATISGNVAVSSGETHGDREYNFMLLKY